MAQPTSVADGVVVTLEYTLEIDNELVESTEEDGPIEYLQGYAEILPALETALYGLKVGEERELVIPPEDGYGEYDSEAFEELPLDSFPDDMDLSLGMVIELDDEDTGESIEGYIAEIRTDSVIVDLNHPLAGETLTFKAKVVGLREATPEELDHGHAHGEGMEHDD